MSCVWIREDSQCGPLCHELCRYDDVKLFGKDDMEGSEVDLWCSHLRAHRISYESYVNQTRSFLVDY